MERFVLDLQCALFCRNAVESSLVTLNAWISDCWNAFRCILGLNDQHPLHHTAIFFHENHRVVTFVDTRDLCAAITN